MNKTITTILNKVNEGKALTEKQEKIYQNFIADVGGERTQPNTDTLLTLLEETPIEETPQEVIQEATPIQEENNTPTNNKPVKLDLNTLRELDQKYKTLSKTGKMKLVGDSNIELEETLSTLGIYGMFERIGKPENEISTYFKKFKTPSGEDENGNEIGYSQLYKETMKLYKKNPAVKQMINENAKGELIMIARDGGGMFLTFARPYKGETITLETEDGGTYTIDENNWKTPIAAFSDGGRGTKVTHTLGIQNMLHADYRRKATDKFQPRKGIKSNNWIVVDTDGDKTYLITDNNNRKEIPSTIGGFDSFIDWAIVNY